jgi:hypothetical protein
MEDPIVSEAHSELPAVVVDPRGADASDDGDAVVLEDISEQGPGFWFLERQQAACRFDNRDDHPEAGEHLCELRADRAATENDDRAGELLGLDVRDWSSRACR